METSNQELMLSTERLLLTPVTMDDLDIYSELFSSPVITRFLPGGKPYSQDYIHDYVENGANHWQKGFGSFTVSLKSAPHVKLGYAGVEQVNDTDYCDIRYAIAERFQGQGYALEAAKAALDFTRSIDLVERVFGVVVIGNHASEKLLYKLDMKPCDERLYDSDDLITMVLT